MTPASNLLDKLAAFLTARREVLLNNWSTLCNSDPTLKTGISLSRQEFTNKVPFMLNVLQQRLRNQPEEAQVVVLAAEHGLHRWQKGYVLDELLTEMGNLQRTLLSELHQFWQLSPTTDLDCVAKAYEHLSDFNHQIKMGSVQQYVDLQRIAAASRVETLEKTLNQLNELSQQRNDLLRRSSRDLRSHYGIIQGTAALLDLESGTEDDRRRMLETLQRNLTNSRTLLTQLMDLSRLEAGQEQLNIQRFDVGQLLNNLVDDYQPLAKERGLGLTADGPSSLEIDSDPSHIQRIIQNLVLNAIKHTDKGWVSVSWTQESTNRWIVCVQDSGPGLPSTNKISLSQVLAPSPESTSAYGLANPDADAQEEALVEATHSPFAIQGEGIGLSIVKGLCELLRASMEIETKPGEGTLFRLRFSTEWQA